MRLVETLLRFHKPSIAVIVGVNNDNRDAFFRPHGRRPDMPLSS